MLLMNLKDNFIFVLRIFTIYRQKSFVLKKKKKQQTNAEVLLLDCWFKAKYATKLFPSKT